MELLKKIRVLFSPVLMGVLLVVIGFFLALATFIENDFGTEVAKMSIYNAWWMEGLFILTAINITGRIIEKKLYKRKKFSIFLFHLAMVIMILGAGLTRYFGQEGMMHIKEGQASSVVVTGERVVTFILEGENESQTIQFDQDFRLDQSFNEDIDIDNESLNIRFKQYYSRARATVTPVENGMPVIGLMISGYGLGAMDYFKLGETKRIGNLTIGFGNQKAKADVNIISDNGQLKLMSNNQIRTGQGQMLPKEEDGSVPIAVNQNFRFNDYQIYITEFHPKATISWSNSPARGNTDSELPFLLFEVSDGNVTNDLIVNTSNYGSNVGFVEIGGKVLSASYAYQTIQLPFSIFLDDFKIERYPGSNSPSSFSSYVTIKEDGYEPVPFHIYMNNILKHHGYRFYQSSYDQDERGTILSVNNDSLGTTVTYIGYFLLFLGILWSMVNKNSFLRKAYTKSSGSATVIVLMLLFSLSASAQLINENASVSPEHAKEFGRLLVQNPKGRTEPISSMASALVRKISRKESFNGLTATQVYLEMNLNYDLWKDIPFIKVSNKALRDELGIAGNYGTYSHFIQGNTYTLQKFVEQAYSKAPKRRGKFDKEVIKVDERVNICYSIFSGQYLKILPVPGSKEKDWFSPANFPLQLVNAKDSVLVSELVSSYFEALQMAKKSGHYKEADKALKRIVDYQLKNASYELPSVGKVKMETLYNSWNIFKRLFPFYATIGFLYLLLLIVWILKAKKLPRWMALSFYYTVLIGFVLHTLGIAARWYISGHAPMSNGYESMIFISWVTILAGFIFNRLSEFALPATAVLAALTLLVSNLSFMDPEITNLVPVLQSYWLTLHVSIIISSYAFLGLGFILAIINLILFVFVTARNKQHIKETVNMLTFLNQKTLIVGVHLLTIGTFLGAIWANESWGRYWGWDAKETWSLITVIVYTFVTHSRLIKGLNGIFLYNVMSLYAFASVLMTYFGVNYYLTGLHSYASGDPIPVPNFVYIAVVAFVILTVMAGMSYRNHKLAVQEADQE